MILDFSFEQVMRLYNIKRWGIVEMSKSQSVAEHSYNVAMISMGICVAIKEPVNEAMTLALVHDLPELVTGDIPTPVKAHVGNDLEHFEMAMFPKLTQHKISVSPMSVRIVKLADLIDAKQFALKFCVDSRKHEIISEMSKKIEDLILDFPLRLIPSVHGFTKSLWH